MENHMGFTLIQDLLQEDRKKNRKYEEKRDKKDVKKLLEVSTEFDVKAVGGQKWTEAARRYLDLQMQRDDIVATLEKTNDELRADVENLFDETDRFASRVVRVGDIVVKLAKESVPEAKEEVDFKAIVDAVSEISEELAEKVAELKKQFTTIKPAAAAKKPALRVDDNTPGIVESISSAIINGITKFVKSIQSWFTQIDSKIDKVEALIAKQSA
jgi:hypothetical protein